MVNQDLFQTVTPDELAVLDEQIRLKKEAYDELATQVKELQGKVKDASAGLTNSEIETEIAQLKKDVASLTK